ncbi:hypothetical protein B0H11DRAFT_2293510 [Mycena galericulata]|nr:hypothetical protein B0H11DRAFT_2293510 [Mycena galericulata]
MVGWRVEKFRVERRNRARWPVLDENVIRRNMARISSEVRRIGQGIPWWELGSMQCTGEIKGAVKFNWGSMQCMGGIRGAGSC